MAGSVSERERIGREALAALERDGIAGALAILESSAPEDALVACNGLARHLFRQRNDVTSTIALLESGIRLGQARVEALEPADPSAAGELRWLVKILAFNLASFLWPGWDDAPPLSPEQVALGLRAAQLNHALTVKAQRGPSTLAVAEWLLGAQLLAARDHDQAIQRFETSAKHARDASDPAAEQLAHGFVAVTRLVADSGHSPARLDLERIRSELAPLKNGPDFSSQLDAALRAFQR